MRNILSRLRRSSAHTLSTGFFGAYLLCLLFAANSQGGTGYAHNYEGQNHDVGCGWDGGDWPNINVVVSPGSGSPAGDYVFSAAHYDSSLGFVSDHDVTVRVA